VSYVVVVIILFFRISLFAIVCVFTRYCNVCTWHQSIRTI